MKFKLILSDDIKLVQGLEDLYQTPGQSTFPTYCGGDLNRSPLSLLHSWRYSLYPYRKRSDTEADEDRTRKNGLKGYENGDVRERNKEERDNKRLRIESFPSSTSFKQYPYYSYGNHYSGNYGWNLTNNLLNRNLPLFPVLILSPFFLPTFLLQLQERLKGVIRRDKIGPLAAAP